MALLPQDPKQQKLVLFGLIPILIAFAYWYFMHQPRTAKIEEMQTHYEELDAKNKSTEAIVKQFGGNLGQQLAIYEQHLGAIEKLIPSRNDIPALLVAMGEQAQANNVLWGGFTPSAEEPGEFYSKQAYEISIVGQYHEVGSYLASVGSLPRIVKPGELKLSVESTPERDPGLAPLLRAIFKVETYVLPMPGDSVAADTTKAGAK